MQPTTIEATNARIDNAGRAIKALAGEVVQNREKTLKSQRAVFAKLDRLSQDLSELRDIVDNLTVTVADTNPAFYKRWFHDANV